jgi:O-methyltransferase domain
LSTSAAETALCSALLQRYPQMRGVVFDQPAVVERAEEPLREAGAADRCRLVGGNFFESVPEGGDAYILKHIIHDWEDEDSTRILQVVRRAIPDNGVVLLIEADLGQPNETPASKFADLNMLVLPGGRERTLDEYAALLESAGFRLERATPTSSSYLVIEGVAVVQDFL